MKLLSVGMGKSIPVPYRRFKPAIVDYSRTPPDDLPPGFFHVEMVEVTWDGYQVLRIVGGAAHGYYIKGSRLRPASLDETVH